MEEWRPLITRSDPDWQWRAQHALDSVRPVRRKTEGKELSFDEMLNIVSMFLALFVAFVVYDEVEKVGFVAHFSPGMRHVLVDGASVFSFVAALMLIMTKVFRLLMGIGIVMFCAGFIFWPAVFK